MKHQIVHFLILTFAALINITAKGQTEAGSFIISGSTGFIFTSPSFPSANQFEDDYKVKNTDFSPQVGIFFIRNCLAGFVLKYTSTSIEKSTQDYHSSSVYAAPVIQIFFGKEQIKPFIYTGIGIGKTKENNYSSSVELKNKIFEAGLGFAAFLRNNISLDVGAAYSLIYSNYDEVTLSTNGFGFQIGFAIYFEKPKNPVPLNTPLEKNIYFR